MKIFITGAASGIGFELFKRLVGEGHYIFLGVHTKKEVRSTLKKVKEFNYSDRVSVIKFDITKSKDRNIIADLDIDCLVNLVGVGIGGSLLNLDVDTIRYNFDVNFFNTLELIQTYIRSRGDRSGKVIVTSSLAGFISIPFLGSYCASKAALSTYIECLNRELKKTRLNVRLKLIEPGAYYTGFNQYMITNKEKLDNSMFNEDIASIINNQNELFNLIEKKSLSSVINTFDLAINSNTNRLKYKVPISQAIFIKLYLPLLK